jgi:hypothetical protein
MNASSRSVRVDIEVSPELLRHLQALAGCTSRRRLEALASQLVIQAAKDGRLS